MADAEVALPPKNEPKRPGTSGTELILRSDCQKASTAFERAQRAEQKYRAHRQATNARKDIEELRAHFKSSKDHFKKGVALTWSAIKAIPAIIAEKQVNDREKMEAKKREKVAEKKKKLEEKIARATVAAAEEPAVTEWWGRGWSKERLIDLGWNGEFSDLFGGRSKEVYCGA